MGFKVGDKVKFIGSKTHGQTSFTPGKIYTVGGKYFTPDNLKYKDLGVDCDDEGKQNGHRFEHWELVSSSQSIPAKFAKGDKVKLIVGYYSYVYKNDVTEVLDVGTNGFSRYVQIKNVYGDTSKTTMVLENELELVAINQNTPVPVLAGTYTFNTPPGYNATFSWDPPLPIPLTTPTWESEITKTKPKVVCECGQAAVSAGWGEDKNAHSSWCPIFKGSK